MKAELWTAFLGTFLLLFGLLEGSAPAKDPRSPELIQVHKDLQKITEDYKKIFRAYNEIIWKYTECDRYTATYGKNKGRRKRSVVSPRRIRRFALDPMDLEESKRHLKYFQMQMDILMLLREQIRHAYFKWCTPLEFRLSKGYIRWVVAGMHPYGVYPEWEKMKPTREQMRTKIEYEKIQGSKKRDTAAVQNLNTEEVHSRQKRCFICKMKAKWEPWEVEAIKETREMEDKNIATWESTVVPLYKKVNATIKECREKFGRPKREALFINPGLPDEEIHDAAAPSNSVSQDASDKTRRLDELQKEYIQASECLTENRTNRTKRETDAEKKANFKKEIITNTKFDTKILNRLTNVLNGIKDRLEKENCYNCFKNEYCPEIYPPTAQPTSPPKREKRSGNEANRAVGYKGVNIQTIIGFYDRKVDENNKTNGTITDEFLEKLHSEVTAMKSSCIVHKTSTTTEVPRVVEPSPETTTNGNATTSPKLPN